MVVRRLSLAVEDPPNRCPGRVHQGILGARPFFLGFLRAVARLSHAAHGYLAGLPDGTSTPSKVVRPPAV